MIIPIVKIPLLLSAPLRYILVELRAVPQSLSLARIRGAFRWRRLRAAQAAVSLSRAGASFT